MPAAMGAPAGCSSAPSAGPPATPGAAAPPSSRCRFGLRYAKIKNFASDLPHVTGVETGLIEFQLVPFTGLLAGDAWPNHAQVTCTGRVPGASCCNSFGRGVNMPLLPVQARPWFLHGFARHGHQAETAEGRSPLEVLECQRCKSSPEPSSLSYGSFRPASQIVWPCQRSGAHGSFDGTPCDRTPLSRKEWIAPNRDVG